MDSGSKPTRREWLCGLGAVASALAGCATARPEATPDGTPAGDSTATPGRGSEPTTTGTPDSTAADPTGTGGHGSSWPTFRGDNRNTGCVLDQRGPLDDPTEKWTVSTEGGVWGSPAVVDGVVYIGSMDRRLYAIDAETGAVEWTVSTGGPVQSSPAVVDGRVYFGSFDRKMYCLDADTGEEQWTYETEGLVNGSPTVAGGTVYVGSGAIGVAEVHAFLNSSDVEQEGGGLYALDAETGNLEWRRFPERLVSSTPAVVDSSLFVGLDTREGRNPMVVSLEAADGDTRWSHETDTGVFTSPSVQSGVVYAGSFGGTVYALATDTGDEEWTFDPGPGDIRGSTAVCEDSVYVPVSGNRPEEDEPVLYSLSLDGEVQWEHVVHHARQMGSSPAVTADAIYVGTHHVSDVGGMYAVSHDGERLWSQALPWEEGVGSSPAVVDGTVYYGADHNTVYAME